MAAGDHGDEGGFFQAAVESSAVAFVVVGADAVVRYHTPAAADMLRGLGTDLVDGVNLLEVPEVQGMVLSLYDMTEHRRALRSTEVDLLTGLGTRRAFETKLDAIRPVTLIVFDLDRFKAVNDTLDIASEMTYSPRSPVAS